MNAYHNEISPTPQPLDESQILETSLELPRPAPNEALPELVPANADPSADLETVTRQMALYDPARLIHSPSEGNLDGDVADLLQSIRAPEHAKADYLFRSSLIGRFSCIGDHITEVLSSNDLHSQSTEFQHSKFA